MTATLLKPVVTGFPVPIAPVVVPGGQICTYRLVIQSGRAIESFPVAFDHPISDRELAEWLTPWTNCGYELIEVSPIEWRVRNPVTGEFETVWEWEGELPTLA
jgi:hypothetical protein